MKVLVKSYIPIPMYTEMIAVMKDDSISRFIREAIRDRLNKIRNEKNDNRDGNDEEPQEAA